jgi:hypothetical protein
MMVFGMRAGLQSYGWLLVVAGTMGVYVWGPLWPHSVARLPQWPWLPIFSVTLVLTALYLKRRLSAGSILFGVTVIAMYFYLEDLVAALSFEASKGKLSNLFADLPAYFVIPLLNVLLNLPVIATFAVLEAAIAMFNRLNKPATIRQ